MLSASFDTRRLQQQLQRIVNTSLPTAISKAEQRTVQRAQKDAQESMRRTLHKPANATVKAVRSRFRQRDAIRAGRGASAVYVQPFLVEALWPVTITEAGNPSKRESNVPKSGSNIIEPLPKLQNTSGNLRGLRRGSLKRIRGNTSKYFEVSERDAAKSKYDLVPGLYERYGSRRNRKIRLVARFRTQRTIKPQWPFRQVVLDSYRTHYARELNEALREEIRKLR